MLTLLLSAAALVNGYIATQVSQRSLDVNILPRIEASFGKLPAGLDTVTAVITNRGVSPVEDIEVWESTLSYDKSERVILSTLEGSVADRVKKYLPTGDTLLYHILPDDITNAIRITQNNISPDRRLHEFYPVLAIRIEFSRAVDKKRYDLSRYLFVALGEDASAFWLLSTETLGSPFLRSHEQVVDSLLRVSLSKKLPREVR